MEFAKTLKEALELGISKEEFMHVWEKEMDLQILNQNVNNCGHGHSANIEAIVIESRKLPEMLQFEIQTLKTASQELKLQLMRLSNDITSQNQEFMAKLTVTANQHQNLILESVKSIKSETQTLKEHVDVCLDDISKKLGSLSSELKSEMVEIKQKITAPSTQLDVSEVSSVASHSHTVSSDSAEENVNIYLPSDIESTSPTTQTRNVLSAGKNSNPTAKPKMSSKAKSYTKSYQNKTFFNYPKVIEMDHKVKNKDQYKVDQGKQTNSLTETANNTVKQNNPVKTSQSTVTETANDTVKQNNPVKTSQSTVTETANNTVKQNNPVKTSQSTVTETANNTVKQNNPVKTSQSTVTETANDTVKQNNPVKTSQSTVTETANNNNTMKKTNPVKISESVLSDTKATISSEDTIQTTQSTPSESEDSICAKKNQTAHIVSPASSVNGTNDISICHDDTHTCHGGVQNETIENKAHATALLSTRSTTVSHKLADDGFYFTIPEFHSFYNGEEDFYTDCYQVKDIPCTVQMRLRLGKDGKLLVSALVSFLKHSKKIFSVRFDGSGSISAKLSGGRGYTQIWDLVSKVYKMPTSVTNYCIDAQVCLKTKRNSYKNVTYSKLVDLGYDQNKQLQFFCEFVGYSICC